jgi:hypothetical protein
LIRWGRIFFLFVFLLQTKVAGVRAEDTERDGRMSNDPEKSTSSGLQDPIPEAWIREIMENRELLESWELLDKMELFHEPDLYDPHDF